MTKTPVTKAAGGPQVSHRKDGEIKGSEVRRWLRCEPYASCEARTQTSWRGKRAELTPDAFLVSRKFFRFSLLKFTLAMLLANDQAAKPVQGTQG